MSIQTLRRTSIVCMVCSLPLVLSALTGCAENVKPWEKGTLARPEMAIEGNRLEIKGNEHIYASREAASGGASVGGGGCGCN